MFHLAIGGPMPESSQTLLIVIFTLPGVFGYLAFASMYRREIDDNFEKVSLVAIFGLLAIILLSTLRDVSSLSVATQSQLTYLAVQLPIATFAPFRSR